ncbi:DUF6252 family protein [Cryomorphaceae bacterium 1068]|nr:DUF6252 family protein [Cryomorphaceae bacterium 1068]
MKHTLLQATALIFVLLFSASCNNSEDPPAAPAPSFKLSGQLVDPATGETSAWSTNTVTAELDAEGFRIKAVRGSDTLFITIAAADSGSYSITQQSPLGSLNRVESVGENGLTLYTFQANGNGGGVFNITNSDSLNKTITGDFFVKYFNPINNSDFFELTDGQFRNISYNMGDDGPDIENPGIGTISFMVGSSNYDFNMATGDAAASVITLTGVTPPLSVPSISLTMAQDIEPGTYALDGTSSVTGLFVQSVTEFFVADSGSMEITAHDTINNNISGNFAFKGLLTSGGPDSIQVTNGTFEMNYIE